LNPSRDNYLNREIILIFIYFILIITIIAVVVVNFLDWPVPNIQLPCHPANCMAKADSRGTNFGLKRWMTACLTDGKAES